LVLVGIAIALCSTPYLPVFTRRNHGEADLPDHAGLETGDWRLETESDENLSRGGGFGRRFLPLFLLGLSGIAAIPLTAYPALRSGELPPGMPDLPPATLVLLSLLNPLILLAIGSALGAGLADRVALTSRVVVYGISRTPLLPHLRAVAPKAMTIGLLLSIVIWTADLAVQPLLGENWAAAVESPERANRLAALVVGILYGGITEEVIVRWGLMSLFAWIGWRLLQRGRGKPAEGVMWGAIVLAAILFGIAHLPAVAAIAPLNSAIVMRTILLNAVGGVVYGWLFWRSSLETAMIAHASGHVGFLLLGLLRSIF
jgi:membrane protease YdiL (CAAX protease family)